MADLVSIVIKAFDETKDGLTGPIRNVGELQGALGKLQPVLLTAAAAAAAAFGAMAVSFINTADEAGKAAQKAGLTTESYTGLAYAADTANIAGESFSAALKDQNKNLVEAATGNGDAAETYKNLGINVTDSSGKIRDGGDVLLEVSDKFAKMEDGAEKSALAMKLFGKAGLDMIPMLNQGSDGIKTLVNDARNFGQVISTDTANAADKFNDALGMLKDQAMGVVNTVVSEFLPAMAQWAESMVKAGRESGIFEAITGTLIDSFKVAIYVGKLVVSTFEAIGNVFKLVGNMLGNLVSNWVDGFQIMANAAGNLGAMLEEVFKGNFSNARNIFDQTLDGIQTDFKAFKAGLTETGKGLEADFKKIWDDLAAGPTFQEINVDKVVTTKVKEPKVSSFGPMPEAELDFSKGLMQADAFSRDLNKKMASGPEKMQLEAEAEFTGNLGKIGGMQLPEDESFALAIQAHEVYEQQLTLITEGENQKRAEIFQATQEIDQALAMERMTAFEAESAQSEMMLQDRLSQIAELGLAEEQALRMSEQANEAHSSRLVAISQREKQQRMQIQMQIAGGVSGILGNMAETAKAFGKKGFAAWKAFSMAQAIVNTYSSAVGAYNAMAGIPFVGPALGIAAAAAAIGAGLANVATISGTQPSGVAHGGLDYVPTESTFLLQKGERVLQPKANTDLTAFLENFNESNFFETVNTIREAGNTDLSKGMAIDRTELLSAAESFQNSTVNVEQFFKAPQIPTLDLPSINLGQLGGRLVLPDFPMLDSEAFETASSNSTRIERSSERSTVDRREALQPAQPRTVREESKPVHVTINLDGRVLADSIYDMSSDGRLEIDARAVV